MLSIVILEEKVMKDRLTYSTIFIPLIALGIILTLITTMTIIVLLFDLIEKGCLSWHRDSLGLLL